MSIGQKRHGVNVIRVEGPCNAVSDVKPDLVWQKCERLASFIFALSAYGCMPLRAKERRRQKGEKYSEQEI